MDAAAEAARHLAHLGFLLETPPHGHPGESRPVVAFRGTAVARMELGPPV